MQATAAPTRIRHPAADRRAVHHSTRTGIGSALIGLAAGLAGMQLSLPAAETRRIGTLP